jgi:hypothetical protein
MNPNMSLSALGAAVILLSILEKMESFPVGFLASIWSVSEDKARDLLLEIYLSGHSLFETGEDKND